MSISNEHTGKEDESSDDIQKRFDSYAAEHYVRIPKKDFDTIIDNKITAEVNSKFKFLFGFTTAVLAVLSAFSFIEVGQTKDSITNELKYFAQNIVNESSDNLEDELTLELQNYIDVSVHKISQDLSSAVVRMEDQISESQSFINKQEYDSLYKLVIVEKNDNDYVVQRLEDLIVKMESSTNKTFLESAIHLKSFLLYGKQRYELVIESVLDYEKRVTLDSATYENAALAAIEQYRSFNDGEYRRLALDFLEKSQRSMIQSGSASALKAEIYAMDFLRGANVPEITESALRNISSILDIILHADSPAPAAEFMERIESDQNSVYKKYVDVIYDKFGNRMESIRVKSNS